MTFWIAPASPGDKRIDVYDRDVSDLMAERVKADARVVASLADGVGLGVAYDVQSQIDSELAACWVFSASIDEARALSQALTTATFRASSVPGPPSTYRSSGRD